MAGGDPLVSLIRALQIMRLVTTFDVASSTIFIWDYILTFSMEVDLVWNSEWCFMKGLYLLQRYLPFIDTVWLVLYRQTEGSLTDTACWKVYHASAVMSVIGLAASEMVLTLRTWAVWHHNHHLSIILPVLYILFCCSAFLILGMFLKSITFSDPPYPGFKGCFLTHANNYLALLWVLLIVWDTLMLILILVPAVRSYRSGGTNGLLKVVYCDGVVYYLYLFVLSFVNVVVVKTHSTQYQHLLTSMERLLHSILTSRVLLHMRTHAGETPVWSDGLTELSTNVGNFHVTS